jgi:hypothetical protein
VPTIHHSSLDFSPQLKGQTNICQVCEYEERGEAQSSVKNCLTHSSRLYTYPPPPVAEPGPARVDNGEPVHDFSWACPNTDWSCWNKFHDFYLEKGMWSLRAGLVQEEHTCLDCCRCQTSSEPNRMKYEAMGIEYHRGGGASTIG